MRLVAKFSNSRLPSQKISKPRSNNLETRKGKLRDDPSTANLSKHRIAHTNPVSPDLSGRLLRYFLCAVHWKFQSGAMLQASTTTQQRSIQCLHCILAQILPIFF